MRVIVGMSGGVDSSVAALLLKRQGYDVTGVFMKNWEEKNDEGVCSSEQDWEDVRHVCDKIDIPYYSVNFTEEYYERVFKIFLEAYGKGFTPNPDVLCNKEIKFKAFLDFALKSGAEKIATGHFVRTNNLGELIKGVDKNKDQSYFLYMLKKSQLKKSLFPVGGLTKEEVRKIALGAGIPVYNKKDSTGICFIGERNFKKFLMEYFPAQKGPMITDTGETVGEHDGLMFYTIGQRKGLGIGGRGDGRSFFVVGKDIKNNALIVAQGEDHPLLFSNSAKIEDITWIDDIAPIENEALEFSAKFRYRQKDQDVILTYSGTSGIVECKKPQRALTPGQSVVFYKGDVCLGGGILVEAFNI
ncbi:MAG: tRNA 2-thiouridine(34) synthase MnmA [Christensenellaceae bacterium]|nr:tRNA 2-thiouridine(34) synthase MnmA [Christensenellaceae bacterium]